MSERLPRTGEANELECIEMKQERAQEQVAVNRARQAFMMFVLSFATFCLFVQIAKTFL